MNAIRLPKVCIVCILLANSIAGAISFASETNEIMIDGVKAFDASNYNAAITYFTKAIRTDTNNAAAYYGRGWSYENAGQPGKAIVDLSEAIRLKPDPRAYLLRGNAYYDAKDSSNALADYSEAIKLAPSYQGAYLNRAQAYIMNGNYGKAIVDCNMAILLNSNDSSAYECRAYIYGINHILDKAVADYSKVIELNPRDASSYAARGFLYFQQSDYTNGIADCKQAIRLDTNCAVAYNNLAWFLSVCPDPKVRDGSNAIVLAKKACELTAWKEPRALGTLAAAYAEVGNFKEAVMWEKKSIIFGLVGDDLKEAQQRLEAYKQGKAYREKDAFPEK